MKIENARVIKLMPVASGTSKSGNEWRRLDYIVEFRDDRRMPDTTVLFLMNDDIEKANIQVGDVINAYINHSTHEWNGRVYPDIETWGVPEIVKRAYPQTTAPQAAAPEQQQNAQAMPPQPTLATGAGEE